MVGALVGLPVRPAHLVVTHGRFVQVGGVPVTGQPTAEVPAAFDALARRHVGVDVCAKTGSADIAVPKPGEGNQVRNAWSSGQMWRGIELILKDRDPRKM